QGALQGGVQDEDAVFTGRIARAADGARHHGGRGGPPDHAEVAPLVVGDDHLGAVRLAREGAAQGRCGGDHYRGNAVGGETVERGVIVCGGGSRPARVEIIGGGVDGDVVDEQLGSGGHGGGIGGCLDLPAVVQQQAAFQHDGQSADNGDQEHGDQQSDRP